MFFGKSKQRKSNVVGTPEYDQYEESDNTQDMLDLQERMRKHGFEGGPGMNKDRWIYGDEIFDIDRPAGGAAQIWSMKEEDYNKLKDLLDKLDGDKDGKKAFKPTPEMEQALRKITDAFSPDNRYALSDSDRDDFYEKLAEFEDKYMPDEIREDDTNNIQSDALREWKEWLYRANHFKNDEKDEEPDSTNLGNIAKSITANDLGRSL